MREVCFGYSISFLRQSLKGLIKPQLLLRESHLPKVNALVKRFITSHGRLHSLWCKKESPVVLPCQR
jgi:hypothetical protein